MGIVKVFNVDPGPPRPKRTFLMHLHSGVPLDVNTLSPHKQALMMENVARLSRIVAGCARLIVNISPSGPHATMEAVMSRAQWVGQFLSTLLDAVDAEQGQIRCLWEPYGRVPLDGFMPELDMYRSHERQTDSVDMDHVSYGLIRFFDIIWARWNTEVNRISIGIQTKKLIKKFGLPPADQWAAHVQPHDSLHPQFAEWRMHHVHFLSGHERDRKRFLFHDTAFHHLHAFWPYQNKLHRKQRMGK
jgi:hypothetical protein